MFTVERFCEIMTELRNRRERQLNFIDKLDEVFPSAFEPIYENFNDYFLISLVAEVMGDKDILEYYFYEKDCKPFSISIDGKEIEINSDVMLYDYIVLSLDGFIEKYSILFEDQSSERE